MNIPHGFENDWIIKNNIKDKINLFQLRSKISEIIASNNLQDCKDKHSTKGSQSYQFGLKEHLNNFYTLGMLCQDLLNSSKIFSKNIYIKPDNGWTVYGGEDGFHTVHRHNKEIVGYIAAVLYLTESYNTKHKPGKFFIFAGNRATEYVTKEGDLIMFPNHLYHGTYPQGPGLRQTLNLEFQVNYA